MLDIPELEEFDKTISAYSWFDEVASGVVAWSRNEYEDFRRKQHNWRLPTSTQVLQYFNLRCNDSGWEILIQQRFNMSIPASVDSDFFFDDPNNKSRLKALDTFQNRRILGWETLVERVVDSGYGQDAMDDLIRATQSHYFLDFET